MKIQDTAGKVRFIAPLLARATLATAFVVSGTGKFKDLEGDIGYFKQLGIPAPKLMVPFVASTEIVCGGLLGAGLLTRLAALPLIPVMAVATLTARRKEFHSFTDLTGVYEFSYIILLAYLALYGGGEASVDRLIQLVRERSSGPTGRVSGAASRAQLQTKPSFVAFTAQV